MIKRRPLFINVLLGLFLLTSSLPAQISTGGRPRSFSEKLPPLTTRVDIPAPQTEGLIAKDQEMEKEGMPYRLGISVEADFDFFSEAEHLLLDDGHLYRLGISAEGATALVLYYDEFRLPEGGELYLYTPDQSYALGAFTSRNNSNGGNFATSLTPGEAVIMEYYHPEGKTGELSLHEIGYAYRDNLFPWRESKGFGSSQWCEVNINCPEGDNWQDEKRGVARILLKIGGGTFWCTGSLVNNTAQDLTPYFLTADHCGQDAAPPDLDQWIFYFNYEAQGCNDPSTEPPSDQMVGCSRVASSGGTNGSVEGADFYLVRLNDDVPPTYNPYFNGWSRDNSTSPSGVGIHHPAGDIKKISTYTQPTYSTQWGGTAGTHWGVRWAATQTSHGVTEGGSSGSPLFDNQGHIIGVLSGGDASCSALEEEDLYGKIWYAWEEGSSPDRRLKDWLDPVGSSGTQIGGSYGNTIYVVADFVADTTIIPVNSTVNFTDRSFGDPESWEWSFVGGNPDYSESQNPSNIRYEQTGTFTVSLKASNGETTNENIKLAYIKVIPNIYPNPVHINSEDARRFAIDFGNRDITGMEMRMFNSIGQEISFRMQSSGTEGVYHIDIPNHGAGVYLLQVDADSMSDSFKMVMVK